MTPPRLAGIDIARGLALIGMFIAHAAPYPDPDAEWIVDGRSSLLFATLAGVSLGLMSGSAEPTAERGRMRQTVVLRALLLILLGLVLWIVPTDIAIILDYYGVMFLLLVPLLFLPRRVLAIVAVTLFVIAPLLADAAQPIVDGATTPALVVVPVEWLLTGYYPALVWLPVLILGLIAARSDLRRVGTQLLVLLGGIGGMLVGYGAAAVVPGVDASAHSATHAEILGSGGFAFTVIGALLLLTGPALGAVGGGLRFALAPVAAMGSMPLTIYTGQILVIASFFIAAGRPFVVYDSWALVVWLIIGSALFALLWRRFVGPGPLEWVMRQLTSPPSLATDRTPTTTT
ncbi:DUF418 domain-containing protein [Cryobacterium sp. BB736]|uniref:DUF418 domain-containing protein n=1 Tax=Cryobacterium sp. BB736 TaxID=2746963 RepID=UPI0018739BFD